MSPIPHLLAWSAVLIIAVAIGFSPEGLGKIHPRLRAHRLSTLILSGFIGLVIWLERFHLRPKLVYW